MPNLLRCALAALLLALAPAAVAQQIDCRTAFADAEETYRNGLFDETIDLLNACLDRDAFSSEERRQAYRLIGLSYIGKDREEDARAAVRALLEIAPGYQSDPDFDPPPFVALVDEMRDEYEAQQPTPRPVPAVERASTLHGFSVAGTVNGTTFSIEESTDSGAGFGVTVGYGLSPNLAAYLKLGGSRITDDVIDEAYTLGNAEIGGRLRLGSEQQRLIPYAGVGFSYQSAEITDLIIFFEDGSFIEDVTIEYGGPGVSVGGGVAYFLTPTLALDLSFDAIFTALEATVSAPDPFFGVDVSDSEDFTSTTFHFGLGVSWHFAR